MAESHLGKNAVTMENPLSSRGLGYPLFQQAMAQYCWFWMLFVQAWDESVFVGLLPGESDQNFRLVAKCWKCINTGFRTLSRYDTHLGLDINHVRLRPNKLRSNTQCCSSKVHHLQYILRLRCHILILRDKRPKRIEMNFSLQKSFWTTIVISIVYNIGQL